MRFEIRAGGGFLILVGLVGLSAGVFGLGLVAGYEMARGNTPDLNQISSTYPLPSPPEKPAPVSEMSSSASAVASPSVASAPAAAPIKPPAPAIGEATPAARTSPATVARLKPPAEAPAASRTATDEDDTDDDSDTAAAPPAPPPPALPPGSRGYNIQIQALMDKSAADEMLSKLKRLGYNGQESKVAFNGQTWYRVRVGPYPSAEEANAAQARLHDQLKQDYSMP
jgi:cell division protein FtsN